MGLVRCPGGGWLTLNSDEQDFQQHPETDTNAWFAARDAVMALRDLLKAAGLAKAFPYLQADVNAFGNGFVNMGRTIPAAARRLAELLRAARGAMGEAAFAGNDREGDA
jgi:hypothetical protein